MLLMKIVLALPSVLTSVEVVGVVLIAITTALLVSFALYLFLVDHNANLIILEYIQ